MSDKLRSILIGAALAGIGAVGAYLGDQASGGAFGSASPFVGMAISVLVNAIRKYLEPPITPPRIPAYAGLLLVVILLGGFAASAHAGPRCCDRPRLRLFRPAPVAAPVVAAPVRYAAPVLATPVIAAPAPVAAPVPLLTTPNGCPGGRCPMPR